MYQQGLMTTYRKAWRRRGVSAWVLSVVILGYYLLTYFTDWLNPVAAFIGLQNKWWLYGALYSFTMFCGGFYFLKQHGNNRYQRVRTTVVITVQILLAFCLPFTMSLFGTREFYFSYLWPLKIEYFYPNTILEYPVWIVVYSFVGSLIIFPTLAILYGKRFYCSWICGCGGLAETAGDPWRHLSDKSTKVWKFEKVSVHSVLFLALATTAVVFINWSFGSNYPTFSRIAFRIQEFYGLIVGALLSGVFAVALYPLFGSRVWCRFFCPMAALLGWFQKVGRFRIRVKSDMCISCGNCSAYCEMGIDVRAYAQNNQDVNRVSCVGCGMCTHVCPRGVLKMEST